MHAVDIGSRPPLWLSIAVAVACLLAMGDWPYGYYQLLRLFLTGYAAWLAWLTFKTDRTTWGWAFAILAVLYNPIFKFSLGRDLWELVNLVSAGVILAELWGYRASGKAKPIEPLE